MRDFDFISALSPFSLVILGLPVFIVFVLLGYKLNEIRGDYIPLSAEFEFIQTSEIYRADDQIPVRLAYKDRQQITYAPARLQSVFNDVKLILNNTKACSLNENSRDDSRDGTHTVYISCTKKLKEPVELFAHYRNKVISITFVPQGQGLLAQQR